VGVGPFLIRDMQAAKLNSARRKFIPSSSDMAQSTAVPCVFVWELKGRLADRSAGLLGAHLRVLSHRVYVL
jgi:hypothetical protein